MTFYVQCVVVCRAGTAAASADGPTGGDPVAFAQAMTGCNRREHMLLEPLNCC